MLSIFILFSITLSYFLNIDENKVSIPITRYLLHLYKVLNMSNKTKK